MDTSSNKTYHTSENIMIVNTRRRFKEWWRDQKKILFTERYQAEWRVVILQDCKSSNQSCSKRLLNISLEKYTVRLFLLWCMQNFVFKNGEIKNKVNRCLARYSLRATTTNRLTKRAHNWSKCQFWAKFGRFGAKNPFFFWRNQKFCYPHNGKPT